jgi:hypothetical protein
MLKQFILIATVLLISCTKVNAGLELNYVSPATEATKTLCEESGGNWQMLRNGCGDKCFRYEKKNVICTMALKAGCDCGPDKCVDSQTQACRAIYNGTDLNETHK